MVCIRKELMQNKFVCVFDEGKLCFLIWALKNLTHVEMCLFPMLCMLQLNIAETWHCKWLLQFTCLGPAQSFACLCVPVLRFTSKQGNSGSSRPTCDSGAQAEEHRGVSCQCGWFQHGHVWMLQETGEGAREGGRERGKVRERLRSMGPLKAPEKVLPLCLQLECMDLVFCTVFWPVSECVSVMFPEPVLVLLLQWRMPIYIPQVSFDYFYLCAALSLCQTSQGSMKFLFPLPGHTI